MKTLLIFATVSASVFFSSCKKEVVDKEKNSCPVVDVSAVPDVVKNSFNTRYPGISVATWFNKDNNSFCAYFIINGGDELAQFANDGNFITEQILTDEEVQSDGNTDESSDGLMDTKKIDTGCKCDLLSDGD